VPAALRVHGALSAVHAWRLVSISGRLDDVRKLGERWRAEVVVGSQRLVVVGQPGAGIPISMLTEGRAIDVVGIVRPANPSSSDRRSNLLPRSTADVRIAGAAPVSGSSTSGSTASGSAGGTSTGAGTATAGDPTEMATAGAVPDRDLVDLEANIGETIRVGGVVVDLRPTGFSLDDGTAIGAIDLDGAAADLRALVEPGDAINVVGRVEPRAGELVVVVDEPALVHLASAPGGAAFVPVVDPPSSTDDPGPDTVPSATVAGFGSDVAGLPGAGFGLMGLLGVALLAAVATVLRRWHARRLLAIRIAVRLAALAGASGPVASGSDPGTRPTTTP
jgi:hypothetical protein